MAVCEKYHAPWAGKATLLTAAMSSKAGGGSETSLSALGGDHIHRTAPAIIQCSTEVISQAKGRDESTLLGASSQLVFFFLDQATPLPKKYIWRFAKEYGDDLGTPSRHD